MKSPTPRLPSDRSNATRVSVALSLLLLVAPGCGSERSEELTARPPTAPAAQEEAPLPPPHTVSVEVEGGRASVRSNQALRLAILEELAEQGGFTLVVGPVEPHAVTLRLEGVPLGDAISAVLGPIPYTAEYSFDRGLGAHVLTRLTAGEGIAVAGGASASAARRVAPSVEEPASESLRRRLERSRSRQSARSRLLAEETRELSADEQELLADLESPDGAVRAEALGQIDAEGGQLPRVIAIASDDPDPRVRAVAATQLGDAGSFEAVAALLDLLEDPEPEVLVATLEALEFAGDESLLPRLKPLSEHSNLRVRAAAEEAISGLE